MDLGMFAPSVFIGEYLTRVLFRWLRWLAHLLCVHSHYCAYQDTVCRRRVNRFLENYQWRTCISDRASGGILIWVISHAVCHGNGIWSFRHRPDMAHTTTSISPSRAVETTFARYEPQVYPRNFQSEKQGASTMTNTHASWNSSS